MEEIALFVSTDVIGFESVNKACNRFRNEGYSPIIIDTGTNRNIPFIVEPPEDVPFYNIELFENAILPFEKRNASNRALSKTLADETGQRFYSHKEFSKKQSIPYYKVDDINSPAAFEVYNKHPNMKKAIIVRGFQIARKKLIEHFSDFFWNVHGGLLPDDQGVYFRGLLLPAHAQILGRGTYGASLHHVRAGIDKGNVIDTVTLPLDKNATVFSLYRGLIDPGIDMVCEALRQQKKRHLEGIPQPEDDETYFSYPEKTEIDQHGIVYCTPEEFMDYAKTHYASTPQERTKLEAVINGFIKLREETKYSIGFNHDTAYEIKGHG